MVVADNLLDGMDNNLLKVADSLKVVDNLNLMAADNLLKVDNNHLKAVNKNLLVVDDLIILHLRIPKTVSRLSSVLPLHRVAQSI